MSARLLDGKIIARTLRAEIAERAAACASRGGPPGLGVLLVGDDPASRSYVTGKERACEENGIRSSQVHLRADAGLEEILAVVERFNRDPAIHGILVQLPLPDAAMEEAVLQAVRPEKDVDGFHPVNVGRALLGLPAFWPCTPHGILKILERSEIPTEGRHCVVIGRSNIVGRPLANLLTRRGAGGDATVTLCHSKTPDLAQFTLQADILIAAAGRPNLITQEMIRPGCTIIDVGVNRVEDATKKRGVRLVGDVDFEGAMEVAGAVTPVPGGVGPMTITMLLHNTVRAAELVAAV
jgi:methylenetetrahydrofolate dehydrogenase (NADP+) / methenyltetrahydrofolate cyclohydrolase